MSTKKRLLDTFYFSAALQNKTLEVTRLESELLEINNCIDI